MGSCRIAKFNHGLNLDAGWLDFPLGNSVGRPNLPDEQRAICLDVLGLASTASGPGAIAHLAYEWPDPTWEDRIVQQYHDEAETVVSQRRHEFDATGVHFAAAEVTAVELMGQRGLL